MKNYHVTLTVKTDTGFEQLEFDIEAEYGTEAIAIAVQKALPFKTIDSDWYYN